MSSKSQANSLGQWSERNRYICSLWWRRVCYLIAENKYKKPFEIAERLRVLIEKHQFIYEGQEMPVTASIGLADYRKGVKTGTDLFKRADEAVYQAKKVDEIRLSFIEIKVNQIILLKRTL